MGDLGDVARLSYGSDESHAQVMRSVVKRAPSQRKSAPTIAIPPHAVCPLGFPPNRRPLAIHHSPFTIEHRALAVWQAFGSNR